ncbi:Multidrug export protein EmrA [compost metagenome]
MQITNKHHQPKKETLTHKVVTYVATMLFLSAMGLGIWFFIFYSNHEETNDAQVEQYVTPIQSRITGFVQEVKYKENQFVHKGDTLIIIDNSEYKERLAMANAELENALETEKVMHKSVATSQSSVAVRKAQLDGAKTQVWKAEQDYKRYENLLKEEAVTVQQFEQMKANYEVARAHYDEVLHAIQSTELTTAEVSSKVPTAAATIKAKQAAVDNASLFLSYTIITAPYDGWVGKRTIQPGQMIKEGQTLLSVVSKEKWITANFKETQLANLSIGQQVEIKSDATAGAIFKGKIESLSPASGARFSLLPPDNATGNFVKIEQRIPVKINLVDTENKTAFLRAGMNVIVVARNK